MQIPLASLFRRWWNVLKSVGRVKSFFILRAANAALSITILSAWCGNEKATLYAAYVCAVLFIPIVLKLRFDTLHEAPKHMGLDVKDTKMLLLAGADPDAKDEHGETPLHKVSGWRGGRGDVCRLLLSHGADRNAKDENGETPLLIAAEKGNLDVFTLLLLHHATLEKGTLFSAAKGVNSAIYKICLAHGDDPNMILDYGSTPLHILFGYGHKKEPELCCRLLLDHDADPNAKTTDVFEDISSGSTPLHLVAGKLNKALRDSDEEDEKAWRSVYNMLLSAGCNPNLANEDGLTPDMIVKGRSAPQKSSQK